MKIKTTDLSKFTKCLIRNRLVANTPEEGVRQRLIQKMICHLGFPKGLIAVEKSIGSRRFDIVCYTKEALPLLLVECKAERIDEGAVSQALGYNETVRAPFICLASDSALKTFWIEKGRLVSVPFLPFFNQLAGNRSICENLKP